jgi:RNA polymerase sigma-32 factor
MKTALNVYFGEIKSCPLLGEEEERALAVRYAESRDPRLAKRLVEANLRLVAQKAGSFHVRSAALVADLIQEGNLGLMEAVRRFDPVRNVRLASYADEWIHGFMFRYLVNNHRAVRGGSRLERKLLQGMRRPSAEVAQELGIAESDVDCARVALFAGDESLDCATEMSQAVAADRHRDVLFRRHLRRFRHSLGGAERDVFERRVFAWTPVSLVDLADAHHISRSRVWQIEKRLVRRLRASLCVGAA